jgi:hypothetical protein
MARGFNPIIVLVLVIELDRWWSREDRSAKQTGTEASTGAFAEIPGIDNEHEHDNEHDQRRGGQADLMALERVFRVRGRRDRS